MPRSHWIRTGLVEACITSDEDGGGFRVQLRQHLAGHPFERELHFDASPEAFATGGGAPMHCPSCRSVQRCDAIMPGRIGLGPQQRALLDANPDANRYRRVHMCRRCFCHFVTAEVSESLILELGERLDAEDGRGEAGAPGAATVIDFPVSPPRRRR